jgi:hypothetical protein
VAAATLPPGNQPPNSVKFFAASELLEQVQDRTWLRVGTLHLSFLLVNAIKDMLITPEKRP